MIFEKSSEIELEVAADDTVAEKTSFLSATQKDDTAFAAGTSEPLGIRVKRHTDIVDVIGYLFGVFALYSLRIPLLPWLWNGPGLDYFIPVMSPVYREGEHWQLPSRRAAIVCHICFGSAMLILALFQVDKTFRQQNKWLHRMFGRAYVVCGLVTIGSLQVLQDSVGAGSGQDRSVALAWFVNVASVGWIGSTFYGVVAARNKQFVVHKNCMRMSLAMAAVPIAQRMFSWLLCAPLAMAGRVFVCSIGFGPSEESGVRWDFTHIRWGPSSDTLWGTGCVMDTDNHLQLTQDYPRDRPFVLSADGYGEGEQLSFGMSAWMGLISLLLVSLEPIMASREKAEALQTSMSEAQSLELVRRIWSEVSSLIEKKTAEKSVAARYAITALLLGMMGSAAAFGAMGSAVGIVLFTFGVTTIVMGFSLGSGAVLFGVWFIGTTLLQQIRN